MTVATLVAPSQKQIDFVNRLLVERDLANTAYQGWVPDWSRATAATASSVITYLLTLPKVASPATHVFEAGVYRTGNGGLVRVYLGQKSGLLLAKRIIRSGKPDGEVSYEYIGVAAKVLYPVPAVKPPYPHTERLTLEEVGALGLASRACLLCGRRLDVPESVDRGIGPVCAANY